MPHFFKKGIESLLLPNKYTSKMKFVQEVNNKEIEIDEAIQTCLICLLIDSTGSITIYVILCVFVLWAQHLKYNFFFPFMQTKTNKNRQRKYV